MCAVGLCCKQHCSILTMLKRITNVESNIITVDSSHNRDTFAKQMFWGFFFLFLAWSIRPSGVSALNIALHAQVQPNDREKIVGSVITTDGLREAFLSRSYIKNVTIFYPSSYNGFFEVAWNYVIIEGWFPSIHHFIILTRNHFPDVKIVFFCLDPTYPGLDQLLSLDFDGVMTNSDLVLRELQERDIPGSRHSLAADTSTMKPFAHTAREIAAIYVGAAGHMLVVKPFLKDMLLEAKKVGLYIYGTGWGAVPELKDVWKGTLPRYELAQAYATAHIVLASTIKSQNDYGMVNNRIYEALACGAIVLSEYSHTLEKEFSDLIIYHNDTWPVQIRLSQILNESPESLNLHRMKARQFIEKYHTWSHRVIDMENFLFTVLRNRFSNSQFHRNAIIRKTSLNVLIVVSDRLFNNLDYYNIVEGFLLPFLKAQGMQLTQIKETKLLSNNTFWTSKDYLDQFHVIFAVCAAFDNVDRWMQQLTYPIYHQPSPTKQKVLSPETISNAVLQRRGVFYFGSDGAGLASCFTSTEQYNLCGDFSRYDVIFYRTNVELSFLRKYFPNKIPDDRVQHLMGVDLTRLAQASLSNRKYAIFICFWSHRHLCSKEQHDHDFENYKLRYADQISQYQAVDKILLLVGGSSVTDWISLDQPTVVDGNQLYLTYHWSNTVHRQDIIFHLFQSAFLIHVFLPDTASKWKELPDNSVVSSALNQTLLFKEAETVDDSISLLSAAAIAGARIHLSEHHHHWLSVAQRESADIWTYESHVKEMMRNGVDRLLGLPPAKAHVHIQNIDLQLHEFSTQGEIIVNTQDSGVLTNSVLQNFLLNELQLPFQVLRISTDHVTLGKDTLLCLNNENPKIPERKKERDGYDDKDGLICMLRSFEYVIIVDGRTPDERSRDSNQPLLWLLLRGTMFSNYSLRQSLPLFFANIPAISKPPIITANKSFSILEEWDAEKNKLVSKWMLSSPRDDVVIYVYRSSETSNH